MQVGTKATADRATTTTARSLEHSYHRCFRPTVPIPLVGHLGAHAMILCTRMLVTAQRSTAEDVVVGYNVRQLRAAIWGGSNFAGGT